MSISRRERGFTLIELMVVIAVLGVVISIAVPSFTTMIQNNRLSATLNDVTGAFHFARSEAVRRGRTVGIEALSTSDLTDGFRVWFDSNGNGSYNSGEELRVVRLSSVVELRATNFVDGSEASLDLSFSPRGTVSGAGNELKLQFCDSRAGNHGKQLRLLASGVLRTSSSLTCS